MKNRLFIALLGTGLGVLLFSASLGLHRDTGVPAAEAAAASIAIAGQQCTSASQVNVGFSWTSYNEGMQWFDLSLTNNGFVPGTFVGIGPLASNQSTFNWDGILPGLTHYLRVNTLTPYGWTVSQTIAFTTRDCQYANINAVIPNQTMTSYPVNGQCPAGAYMLNGLCYGNTVLSQSYNCPAGSLASGGSCYWPTSNVMADGSCANGGMAQNGQCFTPYNPGFAPQAATCYRGYNQMGQCYDTLDPNSVPCVNGYWNGIFEQGMCR